jgi:hypothetical protein
MVEKTEGAIKNGQSRDTGIIGHKIIEQRQTIQKKNAIQKFKVSTICFIWNGWNCLGKYSI